MNKDYLNRFRRIEDRSILFAALTLSFLVRIIVSVVAYMNETWLKFEDDLARIEFANKILDSGFIFNIVDYKSPETIFAPWIPIIIAGKSTIFGADLLPLFLLNAVISGLTCFLIYKIAIEYFTSRVAIIALLWGTFYINYLRYLGTCGNEPWIVFLFIATIYLIIKSLQRPEDLKYVLFSALIFTILFHTDERYISYFALFPLLFWIGSTTNKQKVKKTVLFVFVCGLAAMPWLIRNYMVYDEIVLISVRTTNMTGIIIDHRAELKYNHSSDKNFLTQSQIDSVKNGTLKKFPDGRKFRDGMVAAIQAGNVPSKFTGLEKYWSRLYFLWLPFKFHDNYRISGYTFEGSWSLAHNLSSILSYGVLIPFFFVGMVLLALRNNKFALLALIIIIYHTAVHVFLIPYSRDRYRHPIDFFIIIIGCYGIVTTYEYLKENSGKFFRRKAKLQP